MSWDPWPSWSIPLRNWTASLGADLIRLADRIAANPAAHSILLSMHAMELLANNIESAQDGKDGKDGHVHEGSAQNATWLSVP